MRASWGLDGFKLQGTYMAQKAKQPKLVVVFYNVGAASTQYTDAAKALLAEGGASVVNVVLAQAGATDYSSVINSIRASGDFDAVSLGIDGSDIGYFLKQYQTSGIGKPVITWDGMLSPVAKIAGASAYENVYLGGIDQFAANSANPWAQIMVRTYQATYGTNGFPGATPDYESAGYYDSIFLLWKLYRAVKAKGGDVTDGAQIQAALEADPTTVGIKGGTATAAATYEFDLKTHGLKHVPMGFYQVRNGTPVLLATSDIGGADIKIIALPEGNVSGPGPRAGSGPLALRSEDVPVVLAGPQFLDGFLARDPAGPHHVDPVDDAQQLRDVLLEDQDRDAPLVDELPHGVEDPDGQGRGEAERRLVEQHELRVGHQRHADAEHPLLAAGERPGPLLQVVLDHREDLVDRLEQLARRFGGRRPQRAELQVLGHAELGEDEMLGRDQGHSRRAHFVAAAAGDVLAAVEDLARRGAGGCRRSCAEWSSCRRRCARRSRRSRRGRRSG